jgi:Cyclin, N-terminal domain
MYFLDIFMDNHNIANDRLDLVAFVALLLAAKVEEKETKIPRMEDLNSIIDLSGPYSYPKSDFKALEKMMLKFFDFQVMVPSPATFCEYFVKVCISI